MHQKQIRVKGVGSIHRRPFIQAMHRQNERCNDQHEQVHRVDPCKPGYPEPDGSLWTDTVGKVLPVDIRQNETRQDKKYIDSKASRLKEKRQGAVGIGHIAVSNVKQQD
ncbi:hypothetical protein D3C76_1135600 [compost metagenome]